MRADELFEILSDENHEHHLRAVETLREKEFEIAKLWSVDGESVYCEFVYLGGGIIAWEKRVNHKTGQTDYPYSGYMIFKDLEALLDYCLTRGKELNNEKLGIHALYDKRKTS